MYNNDPYIGLFVLFQMTFLWSQDQTSKITTFYFTAALITHLPIPTDLPTKKSHIVHILYISWSPVNLADAHRIASRTSCDSLKSSSILVALIR